MGICTMVQMVIVVDDLINALDVLEKSSSFQLSIHQTPVTSIQTALKNSITNNKLFVPDINAFDSYGDVEVENFFQFWVDYAEGGRGETLQREFWDKPLSTKLNFILHPQTLAITPWEEPMIVLEIDTPYTAYSQVYPFHYNQIKPLLREIIPIMSPLFLSTLTDLEVAYWEESDSIANYRPWLLRKPLYVLGHELLQSILSHPDFSIRDLEGLGKYYLCNVRGSSYLWIEDPFGIGNERVPDEIHKQYPRNEHRVALQQLISKYLC